MILTKKCCIQVQYLYIIMYNFVFSQGTSKVNFLYGSKYLEEVVSGINLEVSPKTNFWSNVAGAENLGKVVMNYLAPTGKTTVIEMGCGIGLIGLMLAHVRQTT